MQETKHAIATREEWLEARRRLLAKEKELTRLRDELTLERQALPRVRVRSDYRFEGPDGAVGLVDLFGGRSQLLVYHFMMGPGWDEGCPSCSFWADNFDGIPVHLAHRDISFVAVSRAPFAKIDAYRRRMGWRFPWFSSADSDFNFDFNVSFTAEQNEHGGMYNFREIDHPDEEAPGISTFALDGDAVYHTYSAYARGLEAFNGAYQLMDLAPNGRNEAGLSMA